MSSRYQNALQIKDSNGIRRAQTWIYAVPDAMTTDIFIITTTPERLDNLASDFYDDPQMWWLIATANGLGKGSLMIPENTRIRIPDSSAILELMLQKNETR